MYDVGMRSTACAILLLALASCAQAQTATPQRPGDTKNLQTGYCPQTRQLEAEPAQRFFLDGTIGKHHVRMYLDRGGSGVVGLFFDMGGNWDITLLGGAWNNGEIDASDATENHPVTGRLRASLFDNHMVGTWVANGNAPEPVELVVIPQPRCDGKEAWKLFDDPAWPASFSYPASWHLEESDDSITLTCPNPSEIAYDQHVTIDRGTGSPQRPTGLIQCGNSWIYGWQCDCDQKDTHACPAAKVNRTKSATVLDVSEHEWRIYCKGGGYVAQGEGEDRLVLFQDQWLEITGSPEIVDHLTGTVKPRLQRQPQQ